MSSTTLIVVVAIVVLLVVVVAARARSRRLNDGVDSFRRQIDALSPEARRPVVDQVQSVASRQDPADDDDRNEPDDGGDDDERGDAGDDDESGADEDGRDGA